MTSTNKLERDELLDEINRLADDLGTTPTASAMNEHGQYSTSPYYRVFGSWSAALQAAGFESPTVPKERSTAELRKVKEKASRFSAGMNPTTGTLTTSFILLDSIL